MTVVNLPSWESEESGHSLLCLHVERSAQHVFECLFSAGSELQAALHQARGDTDFVESSWVSQLEDLPVPQYTWTVESDHAVRVPGRGSYRKVRFCSAPAALAQKPFSNEEIHWVREAHADRRYVVDSVVYTNAMYGDKFNPIMRYTITGHGASSCILHVSFTMVYSRGVNGILRQIINKGAEGGMRSALQTLRKLMPKYQLAVEDVREGYTPVIGADSADLHLVNLERSTSEVAVPRLNLGKLFSLADHLVYQDLVAKLSGIPDSNLLAMVMAVLLTLTVLHMAVSVIAFLQHCCVHSICWPLQLLPNSTAEVLSSLALVGLINKGLVLGSTWVSGYLDRKNHRHLQSITNLQMADTKPGAVAAARDSLPPSTASQEDVNSSKDAANTAEAMKGPWMALSQALGPRNNLEGLWNRRTGRVPASSSRKPPPAERLREDLSAGESTGRISSGTIKRTSGSVKASTAQTSPNAVSERGPSPTANSNVFLWKASRSASSSSKDGAKVSESTPVRGQRVPAAGALVGVGPAGEQLEGVLKEVDNGGKEREGCDGVVPRTGDRLDLKDAGAQLQENALAPEGPMGFMRSMANAASAVNNWGKGLLAGDVLDNVGGDNVKSFFNGGWKKPGVEEGKMGDGGAGNGPRAAQDVIQPPSAPAGASSSTPPGHRPSRSFTALEGPFEIIEDYAASPAGAQSPAPTPESIHSLELAPLAKPPSAEEMTPDQPYPLAPLMVPPTTSDQVEPGSTDGGSVKEEDIEVEEVFENERFQPFRGWGHTWPGHFLPSDRVGHWSDRSGRPGGVDSMNLDKVAPTLKPGWQWSSDWQVDHAGLLEEERVDQDGWCYGVDFGWIKWPPPPQSGRIDIRSFVRRRRWVRTRIRDGVALADLPHQEQEAGVQNSEPGDLPSLLVSPKSTFEGQGGGQATTPPKGIEALSNMLSKAVNGTRDLRRSVEGGDSIQAPLGWLGRSLSKGSSLRNTEDINEGNSSVGEGLGPCEVNSQEVEQSSDGGRRAVSQPGSDPTVQEEKEDNERLHPAGHISTNQQVEVGPDGHAVSGQQVEAGPDGCNTGPEVELVSGSSFKEKTPTDLHEEQGTSQQYDVQQSAETPSGSAGGAGPMHLVSSQGRSSEPPASSVGKPHSGGPYLQQSLGEAQLDSGEFIGEKDSEALVGGQDGVVKMHGVYEERDGEGDANCPESEHAEVSEVEAQIDDSCHSDPGSVLPSPSGAPGSMDKGQGEEDLQDAQGSIDVSCVQPLVESDDSCRVDDVVDAVRGQQVPHVAGGDPTSQRHDGWDLDLGDVLEGLGGVQEGTAGVNNSVSSVGPALGQEQVASTGGTQNVQD